MPIIPFVITLYGSEICFKIILIVSVIYKMALYFRHKVAKHGSRDRCG